MKINKEIISNINNAAKYSLGSIWYGIFTIVSQDYGLFFLFLSIKKCLKHISIWCVHVNGYFPPSFFFPCCLLCRSYLCMYSGSTHLPHACQQAAGAGPPHPTPGLSQSTNRQPRPQAASLPSAVRGRNTHHSSSRLLINSEKAVVDQGCQIGIKKNCIVLGMLGLEYICSFKHGCIFNSLMSLPWS